MSTVEILKRVRRNIQQPGAYDGRQSCIGRPHCVLGEIKCVDPKIKKTGIILGSRYEETVFTPAELRTLWGNPRLKTGLRILDAAIARWQKREK